MASDTAISHLQAAQQRLRSAWEQTTQVWRDAQVHDFQRMYIDPIEQETSAMLSEMQRMAEVLADARNAVQ